MKVNHISDMENGWFIGDFSPTILETTDFEVAVKNHKAGYVEKSHYHKRATEVIVVVSGKISMNDIIYTDGSIITHEPFEVSDFCALTDVTTAVVKFPSLVEDKYYIK
ncbi:cupin domain-containing protein [Ornithinibacillus contaminans]|uniref:hypothetical protein n=1 Tax=Ornithinibacillus contaminans TaxID=694055 RepID=UPI00064DF0F1|nr:hypothetical protein [Ornithinibacillus contaminans]